MRKIIILFFLVVNSSPIFSQDLQMYHGGIFNPMLLQHSANKYFFNPSAIGETEDQVFTTAVSVNSAANGYSSAACYEFPTIKGKHAFAIQVNNYQNGVYRNMEMRNYVSHDIYVSTFAVEGIDMLETSLLYSRSFYIDGENKINVGAQAVFKRFKFLPDMHNPVIFYNIQYPVYAPDINFGAQYSRRKFYIGASVKNLFEPHFTQQHLTPKDDDNGYKVTYFTAMNHMTAFITAGNTFQLSDKTNLQTSLLICTDDANMYASNFDLNNTFVFNKKGRIGFSIKDPSMYTLEMYNKYGGYQLLGKRSFGFNNFALNTGYTFNNVEIGFAFASQLNNKWFLNAGEGYLKVRI
ncbi:MAG: type IX secretion system membrane protein PorP/SprF [Sphingobacteriales bacterium]|nr:MAG: type IX secretion system membrane protein PorP/SprF [Sphingobacteriales bacterium]